MSSSALTIIPTAKECSCCKIIKINSDFAKSSRNSNGLQSRCKACCKTLKLEYRSKAEVKLQEKLYAKEYNQRPERREKAKKHARWYSLQRHYNMSLDQYNDMFLAQSGCCSICKKHQSEFSQTLAVDHCHQTNAIRGLLCGPCNKALGLFKDNIKNLDNAKAYLKKSRKA